MNAKLPTAECWARAGTRLMALLGCAPDRLFWDGIHCLQGHAHVAGREFIVIASRDDEHDAMVFTTDDWDEVRRSSVPNRDAMLQRCAITDHARLVELLATA